MTLDESLDTQYTFTLTGRDLAACICMLELAVKAGCPAKSVGIALAKLIEIAKSHNLPYLEAEIIE